MTPILYYGITPPPPTPSVGQGNTFPVLINQPGHGFVVGDVLAMIGATYVKAKADTPANAEVVGIVEMVLNADKFMMATPGGKITGLSGLTAGTTYFLSDSVAGMLTTSEPAVANEVSKPLLIADTPTSGYFFNFRGMVIPSGTLTSLMIGTDLRFTAITGGGKLEARNVSADTWATVDQWTNP